MNGMQCEQIVGHASHRHDWRYAPPRWATAEYKKVTLLHISRDGRVVTTVWVNTVFAGCSIVG